MLFQTKQKIVTKTIVIKKKEARDKYNIPEEKIKKIIYEKIKYNMTEEQENKRREYEKNRHCYMTEEEKIKEENMQEIDIIC